MVLHIPRCIFLSTYLLSLSKLATAGLASSIPPFSAERDAMQYVVAIDGQGMHTSLYRCSITAFHPDAAPWPADAPVTPMTDHKGRRYECAIPPSKPPTDDTSAAKGLLEHAIEGKSPLELLETLGAPHGVVRHSRLLHHHRTATKCLYRTIDWWTYEVCYKQHVRQFHNDPTTNKLASEYLLGNYDPAGDQPAVQADSTLGLGTAGLSTTPSRYVAQRYTNGEACDVTDEPRQRSTEVRFVCAADGRDVLVGVTEPQTCQYVITIATKVLCRHEAFQVKEPAPSVVRCRQLDAPADVLEVEQEDKEVTASIQEHYGFAYDDEHDEL